MASFLATGACRVDPADLPNGMDRVQSAAYQKDRARRRAFLNWEKDYWLAHAHNDLQVNATGFPLDGAAYQYVISNPPPRRTIPCGTPRQLWKKTSRVETHGVLFSRGGPHLLPSN
jgi:hypothetical protein